MSETVQLLRAARRGDRKAVDALFARHRGRLLAFLQMHMRAALTRRVQPEDVLQETLLEAARKLDGFEPEGPASFYRWLVRIARFKVSEAERAWAARKRALETPLDGDPVQERTGASGLAVRAERAGRLREALEGLAQAQGEAIRLRYLEGLSTAETAERMERSEAAVKSVLSRGFEALRRSLAGRI